MKMAGSSLIISAEEGINFDDSKVKIIDRAANKDELQEKECHWIIQYDSEQNGLNLELPAKVMNKH